MKSFKKTVRRKPGTLTMMMNRAQSAILPAAILGSVFVIVIGVFVSSLMSVPGDWLQPVPVHAVPVPEPPAGEQAAPEEAAAAPVAAPQGECTVSGKFPEKVIQWCGLISRYAAEAGLEPNLVAAVMLQESGGDAKAYSKSGAVGLLQVMPRDGLAAKFMCVNGPCFTSRPTISELEDPEFNVSYGTRMLSGLLSKTGDIREALKAYGPKDVGYYYADIVLTIFNNYR